MLSRAEIDRVFLHLATPHDLVVKVLFGCGLRLFECLGLRVQAINLDAEVITVHDGKGGKDRAVPLPKTLKPLLVERLEGLRGLHRQDLAAGYSGVFLVNALEKKYAKETISPLDFWRKDPGNNPRHLPISSDTSQPFGRHAPSD